MKSKSDNPWDTISIHEVYDNPWIQVTHRDVITPGKTEGIYGVVHFKNLAIGILPLDEEYNTWLVGQYRYTLEEYSWEIPEGGGEPGSTALDSAKRELLEETGITAATWKSIIELTTSNSVTDERAICYVAKDLSFGKSMPEATEDLEIRKLPFEEVVQMAMDGKITDAISVATIFKVKLLIEQGKL